MICSMKFSEKFHWFVIASGLRNLVFRNCVAHCRPPFSQNCYCYSIGAIWSLLVWVIWPVFILPCAMSILPRYDYPSFRNSPMLFLLLGLPPKLVPSPIVTRFYLLYREMVRLYKTKNLRAQWSEEDAGIAVAAVEGGMSLKKSCPRFSCSTYDLTKETETEEMWKFY